MRFADIRFAVFCVLVTMTAEHCHYLCVRNELDREIERRDDDQYTTRIPS